MWNFNWGVFWALLAYGVLKFAIKRMLGFYEPRVIVQENKQPVETDEARQAEYRYESMTGPRK